MIGENFLQDLYNRIYEEKAIAVSEDKPLLILISESHRNLSEYFVELMIVQLVSQFFSVRKLMLELSKSSYTSMRNIERIYKNSGRHGNMQSLYYFLKKNGMMTTIPIDLGKKDNDDDWNIKPVGVKHRNKVMCLTAHERAKGDDAVAVVGYKHLYGLINETKLSELFHVFSINTAPKKNIVDFDTHYARSCHQFAFSENIFQLSPIVSGQSDIEVEHEALELFEKQSIKLPSLNTIPQKVISAFDNLIVDEGTSTLSLASLTILNLSKEIVESKNTNDNDENKNPGMLPENDQTKILLSYRQN
jgi:hypothetical protein